MGPTITFLISIGLCLGWAVWAQMDPLPRPTLWAVPSPVVPGGADVILWCQGHLGSDRFQLWRDGEFREERNASWQQAQFMLRNVDAWRDGRSYSCRSGQGPLWSDLSDPLAVVVTGDLPAPLISASHGSTTLPGTKVTISCQMSVYAHSQDYSFALLEAKTLEPLKRQSPAEGRAIFLLPSVTAEDTGSYSCIYYRKTAPYKGSHPSKTLELTVFDPLPKPTLWARSSLVVAPGANITLWCSKPKLSFLEEVTFILWKTGTQESLQQQISADLWTSFLLPSLRPKDTGSYRCTYMEQMVSARGSKPSEALEMVVPGSLPKPSLSALPGLVVEPRMHVTLQCWQPPHTSLWRVTFILLKVGSAQALQSQSPAGNSADFPLLSVRAQDAGNYSCVYYERMAPYQVSELSEVLEIWVTDALPKPFLSAQPGPEVDPGANVTLLCWGPSRANRFVLYKEGDEKTLLSMGTTQDGAQFFLTQVTLQHSGNYSCRYHLITNISLWTQHSDPFQLIVKGSEPNNTLLIILSCVSFLLLLLCLLLMAVLCQGSIHGDSLQGDSPRRHHCCPCLAWSTCLPCNPESPRGGALYAEVAKERPRDPSVTMAEGSQEVTYSQLNIRALNKRKVNPKETPTEPTFHATVALN